MHLIVQDRFPKGVKFLTECGIPIGYTEWIRHKIGIQYPISMLKRAAHLGGNMQKTLIYFPPEYRDLALKIRENYIEHHHGEVDLVSETDQNDIKYASYNFPNA